MLNYVRVLRKNLVNLDAPSKTYAVAQSRDTMDIQQVAEHMADHQSPFSAGVISGVLTDLANHMAELLLDGHVLNLGWATINVALKSDGVCESVADEDTGEKPVFTPANITGIKLRFTPGAKLRNLRQRAQFHEVDARKTLTKSLKKKADALTDGTWKSA